MKKHERIEQFVADLSTDRSGTPASSHLHPCYTGYFTCFNRGDYYEAHDVLEHLWLSTTGPDAQFYKGLIQAAGAFVHLRKQFEAPHHPKHGRRLRPAVRLFDLARRNLSPFRPRHHQLDVEEVCRLCNEKAAAILDADFEKNPWRPDARPRLEIGVK